MFIALVITVLLAIIWILLKLLGKAVKLPFKFLKVLFSKPVSTVFWILVIAYIGYYFFLH